MSSSAEGTFEVHNEQLETHLRDIGHSIQEKLPKGWGFSLFLFSFGEGGATFYISDGVREDVLKAMKEFIEKQEAMP